MSVAISPDSTRIVSGSLDQTICVWAVPESFPSSPSPPSAEVETSSMCIVA
ncbi:hypothetical protein BDV93DRAFT_477039 [Ceratobasidium sp. AG-I]|nr:hypothetical protein BDV93DRAFT_477039 [Ceratobasidium sp. AG-I]